MYFNKLIKDGYNLLIIWAICSLLLINHSMDTYLIIPLCIGTIIASLLLILENIFNKINYFYPIFTLMVIISIIIHKCINSIIKTNISFINYIFFIPLFIYIMNMYYYSEIQTDIHNNSDFNDGKKQINEVYFFILSISIFIVYGFEFRSFLFISICILSKVLSYREKSYHNLINKYHQLYSYSDLEKTILKEKINLQIENENNLIENAILNERNRISRDIHDSLGHLTSRGILQIGAMMVTEKDEIKRENLKLLKDTLSEGMSEVRRSLHNFQNESINIEFEIEKILNDFNFCNININKKVSISDCISLKQKYTILYIIKESLTNVIKHSNATKVEINISEISNNIYLNISDNGDSKNINDVGIGIHSMKQRIYELDGKIAIYTNNGFKIFITIPKNKCSM